MFNDRQVASVLQKLHELYPNLKHYLNFSNPVELLVATILSAQVRDTVVNEVTIPLFKKYKSAQDFAKADIEDIVAIVKKVTFANNKAKYIKEACSLLVDEHGGKVPRTVEELTKLPGIGKKTAHAILQNAFDIVEGVVVDTHGLRLSYRLGWTDTDKNADKAERQLCDVVPKKEWKELPWLFKEHGRAICKAPVPTCSICPISDLCPKRGVVKHK